MDDDAPELALPAEEPQGVRTRRVKASNLLWFISSRPYVPMSDLRRRFGLDCEHGTVVRDEQGPLHVGLPRQAAEAILELMRKNKIGLEYDYRIAMRVAIGVYPLRVRTVPSLSPRTEPRPRPAESRAELTDTLDEGEVSVAAETTPEPAAAPPSPQPPSFRRRNRSRRRR